MTALKPKSVHDRSNLGKGTHAIVATGVPPMVRFNIEEAPAIPGRCHHRHAKGPATTDFLSAAAWSTKTAYTAWHDCNVYCMQIKVPMTGFKTLQNASNGFARLFGA